MRSKSRDRGVGCYPIDLLDHYHCKNLRPMGGERRRCSPSQYKKTLISWSQQCRKEDYEQINPDWDPKPPSAFRPLIVNATWRWTSLFRLT